MKIVQPTEIPKQIINTPIDDLPVLYKTCVEMQQICTKENGVGLSAVQVGIPWKLFIIRTANDRYKYHIDCEYSPVGEAKLLSIEGCLSLRDLKRNLLFFQVERYKKVLVAGFELLSDDELKVVPFSAELDDLDAIVYQHEIDHHHGILINRGKRKFKF